VALLSKLAACFGGQSFGRQSFGRQSFGRQSFGRQRIYDIASVTSDKMSTDAIDLRGEYA